MKKTLLAATLFLGLGQLAFSAEYDENTYYNGRYGFKVSYPALTDANSAKGIAFELGEEPANGDGNTMSNLDGNAGILVYGTWSGLTDPFGDEDPEKDLTESGMVIGCTLNTLLQGVPEGSNVTYERQVGNSAVISGVSGDSIFYKKTIYTKGAKNERCLFLSIDYPVSEKEKYDPVVKGVVASFEPLKEQ